MIKALRALPNPLPPFRTVHKVYWWAQTDVGKQEGEVTADTLDLAVEQAAAHIESKWPVGKALIYTVNPDGEKDTEHWRREAYR